jgi:uncharacterized phiE125 gp8 family phage protein
MFSPVLVTPPAITPVSLVEIKAHCRAADFSDDDVLLTAYLSAAVSHLDGWTGILGRALVEQTWRQDFEDFRSCLRLPLFPVISASSLKYLDTDGAEQTVAAENYSIRNDAQGAYVRFLSTYSFPSLNAEGAAVSVTYSAGYATTGSGESAVSSVPQAIKQAILLLVGHWYENREAVNVGSSVTVLPMAVDVLLAPFRRMRV